MHIVTLKLASQLGCGGWDLEFQYELNDIISAHKMKLGQEILFCINNDLNMFMSAVQSTRILL